MHVVHAPHFKRCCTCINREPISVIVCQKICMLYTLFLPFLCLIKTPFIEATTYVSVMNVYTAKVDF